jgi:hypothetical protein
MIVMRLALVIALGLTLASCAGTRPMAQMQGGCANYEMDVARELALAKTEGASLAAVANAQESMAALPLDQKITVNLLPQREVKFRRAPERRQESTDRYGGMVVLRVPSDAAYRIGTSTAAWVDVLTSAGAAVRPGKFEMQTACKDVFKTVVFALRADEMYTVQLSASRTQALPVYIVPDGR